MKPITIQQIRSAVAGKAISSIPASVPEIVAVCTDTRRMEPGSLFVALKGENHNAHTFLSQAAAGGAIAALVDEAPHEALPNVHLIQVPDTRVALGKLARFVRSQMKAKVIAVAGSNGKTGTKYLIDAVLREKLKGSISPKSYNNDIGVPLAIFPADPFQDYLVLEMGTNHPGEIKVLTEMAQPDIAVITNCSAEHLEGLGDLMGVRRENASIISGLNPRGLLIVNGDEPELLEATADYPGKRITFGFKETNDLFAHDVVCDQSGVRFQVNNRPHTLFIPLLGKHTAANALAAIAVARRLGLDEADIFQNLRNAQGPEMRLQLEQISGITLLNDAYNANPASMRAALETVCALGTSGRRIAIVGDMLELGDSSERYHKEIGQFIAAAEGLDEVICVGAKAALISQSAKAAGLASDKMQYYRNASEAAKAIPPQLRSGDLVLLKASRSIHLESVARAIIETRSQQERLAAS